MFIWMECIHLSRLGMNRIKVINEAADLVQLLRAVDTKVKREVFKEVSTDWRTSEEIKKRAKEFAMKSLREDGLKKAIDGLTTPEEVIRVTTEVI